LLGKRLIRHTETSVEEGPAAQTFASSAPEEFAASGSPEPVNSTFRSATAAFPSRCPRATTVRQLQALVRQRPEFESKKWIADSRGPS
jgi:hypothetical protein